MDAIDFSGNGLSVVERLGDVPKSEWSRLALGGSIFLDPRWLELVEDTAGVPLSYHWLNGEEGLRAALTTAFADHTVPWVLNLPSFLLKMRVDAGIQDAIEFSRRVSTEALLPVLIAGGRHIGHSRLLSDSSVLSTERDRLIADVEERAREIGARSVAFPFVDEADSDLMMVLDERRYQRFSVGEYYTLGVDSGGFDSYLARLPRKRRTSVRHERELIKSSDISFSVDVLGNAPIGELAQLEANLMGRYGTAWNPHTSVAFFESLIDRFGDDVFVTMAHSGGAVRGFGLVFSSANGVWYLRQAGFDYEYLSRARLPLYFEMMYYRVVELAAQAGIHSIHYGLGSGDAKRSRGCAGSMQYCYVLPV